MQNRAKSKTAKRKKKLDDVARVKTNMDYYYSIMTVSCSIRTHNEEKMFECNFKRTSGVGPKPFGFPEEASFH